MENRKLILFLEVDIECQPDFNSKNLKDAIITLPNTDDYTVLNTSVNVITQESGPPIWVKPR